MKIRISYSLFLCVGFFALTIGNSKWLETIGVSRIITYAGLLCIITAELFILLKVDKRNRIKTVCMFILLSLFLSFGITQQNLPFKEIIILIISVILLAYLATMSVNIINNYDDLRKIGNSILAGTLITFTIALFSGTSCSTDVLSGMSLGFGFNSGLQNKNDYAFTMLCVLISHIVFDKCSNSGNLTKKKITKIMIFIDIMLIFISSSMGAYICCLLFVLLVNLNKLIKFSKAQNKLFFVMLISCIVGLGIYIFMNFAIEIPTFQYRYRGMENYITYYKGDWFHKIFGDAELAFANQDKTLYITNIQTALGYDGTVEMALINILFKSGILGVIAYIIYFVTVFRKIIIIKDVKLKYVLFSISAVLLLSAFVETYLCNIRLVFGVFCYVVIGGLFGIENRQITMPKNTNV